MQGKLDRTAALSNLSDISKPVIGKSCFVPEIAISDDKISLMYYHSYKKDFCDASFSGHLRAYEPDADYSDDFKCELRGIITPPRGMKIFAVIFLIACIALGILYFVLSYFYELFDSPLLGLMIGVGVGVFVYLQSVRTPVGRVNEMIDFLQKIIDEDKDRQEL